MDTNMQLNEELGEIICPECKGFSATEQGMYMIRCPKCQGAGKLDWCQQAVGVPPPKSNPFNFGSCNVHVSNYATCAAMSLASCIDTYVMSCSQIYPEHNDKEDARRYMNDN